MDRIIFGLNQKCRGRPCADRQFRRQLAPFIIGRKICRINENYEVGTTAYAVNVVDRFVCTLFVVVAQRGGEMSARGEAKHANAIGIEVPLVGMGADYAEGSLCILQRCRVTR